MDIPELLDKRCWRQKCPKPKPSAEIKKSPEDFIVEEITSDGKVLEAGKDWGFLGGEGDFLCIVVEKRGWATDLMIKALAKRLGISKKRVGFAGTKDKKATTVQLISIYKGRVEDVESISLKDVFIRGMWFCDGVRMGGLKGNRFTIRLEDYSKECLESIEGRFPNYFGEQRFGRGWITHKVGYCIVKGDFESAVKLYLASTTSEREEVRSAKEELKESWDYSRALREFPKYLKHERTLLAHLSKHPNDYVNALRKLPRGTLLMFVHALQSFIFNEYVERGGSPERWCGKDALGFPDMEKEGKDFPLGVVVGYETKAEGANREILEELGLEERDFLVKSLPEISSKGTLRPMEAPFVGFEDLGRCVRFSLPAGSYATTFLREIVEIKR